MKAISASIIVLAGAVLLAVGANIQHGDTNLVVSAIGCLVGLIGLAGWAVTLRGNDR